MGRSVLIVACLAAFVGCTDPDSAAGLQAQWEADSARYTGFDCERVRIEEEAQCERVNQALLLSRLRRAAGLTENEAPDSIEFMPEGSGAEFMRRSSRPP